MEIAEKKVKKIVVLAAIAASFAAIFVRLTSADPMAIGFYRLLFCLPFFGFLVFKSPANRKELKEVSPKHLLLCFITGVFLMLHFFTYFTAIGYTSVASAVVLGNCHPIIVLILSYVIFKERTKWKAILGIFIAIVGCAIIAGGDYSFAGLALLGDVLALAAALFLALYYMMGRNLRPKINAAVYIFLIFSGCFLAFLIGMILTRTPFSGYVASDWLCFLGLAVVCHIGNHAVINWSLGYVKPVFISTIGTIEAVSATILAIFIFGEFPSITQVLGGVVVIVGILLYITYDAKQEEGKAIADTPK